MFQHRLLEKYNNRKLEWFHDALFFAGLVVIVFLIFRFLIGVSFVSGDSMSPSLEDGECVIYLRPTGELVPGDVISLWVPSGDYYVKRVIAVGGDEVNIKDGCVYINGELYEDEYGYGTTEKEEGAVIYPYTVREGNVFVLGDNRENSKDSRAFGEVNEVQIKGRIIFHF